MEVFLGRANQGHATPIRWNTICKPYREGGLGIRKIQEVNDACILLRAWKMMNDDSLWAKYMQQVFLRKGKGTSRGNLYMEKAKLLGEHISEGASWTIADGKSII